MSEWIETSKEMAPGGKDLYMVYKGEVMTGFRDVDSFRFWHDDSGTMLKPRPKYWQLHIFPSPP